jgi:hypothetical protein
MLTGVLTAEGERMYQAMRDFDLISYCCGREWDGVVGTKSRWLRKWFTFREDSDSVPVL